ncbi:MAG: hypothetical protein K6U88_13515 [Dehalococcoidia bacterium]|nr:hypothetical protein [Dehalococcoidia bacterium]
MMLEREPSMPNDGPPGQDDFRPDTICTVVLRDATGRERPVMLYVHRAYPDFLVARSLEAEGLLRKIAYSDVARVLEAREVSARERRPLPAALLEEKLWRERTELLHYASRPDRGK